MARYYEYHSGPYGYGIRKKEISLPLGTGTYTDQALSGVLLNAQLAQQAGTELGDLHNDLFRKVIERAVIDYQAEVERKGFLQQQNITNVQHTMLEQSALIEGLAWSWILGQLPGLLKDYEILDVQREETFVIPGTCTCITIQNSTSNWTFPQHHRIETHQPACQGIVIMSKPDFVCRHKATGAISQHDFKTHGYVVDDRFVESHRDSVQMAVQSMGIEARLGTPVNTYWIHALVKGGRGVFSKKGEDVTGKPKSQYSDLCYAKIMPPNPPINDKTIVDYKGFWYSKQPVWELMLDDKPVGYTHMEYWVSLMPKETLYAQTVMCGPYERPAYMIQDALDHIKGEEKRWINTLWDIHNGGNVNELVSRSYDCKKYGEEYRCDYYDICFKGTGWQDPLGSGKYVHRLSHHVPEIDQMKARGIPVPEER